MFSASATCSLISSPPDAMQGRQALQEQSYKATAAVPPPPPPPRVRGCYPDVARMALTAALIR